MWKQMLLDSIYKNVGIKRVLCLHFVIDPFPFSFQQAFNATAVVRHMRRLQLGSSMGSSMDASNPPTRLSQAQKPAQVVQSQAAQSQNAGQAQSQSPNMAASKTSSIDNNIAAPRKECESREHMCVSMSWADPLLHLSFATTTRLFVRCKLV